MLKTVAEWCFFSLGSVTGIHISYTEKFTELLAPQLQQRTKTLKQNAVCDGDRWYFKTGLDKCDIRRYRTRGQQKQLLWLASVTTVTACHMSGLKFIFQQKVPNVQGKLFSDISISQGSVAMCLRFRGNFHDSFIANSLLNVTVKELWKLVNICQSYGWGWRLIFDARYTYRQQISQTMHPTFVACQLNANTTYSLFNQCQTVRR